MQSVHCLQAWAGSYQPDKLGFAWLLYQVCTWSFNSTVSLASGYKSKTWEKCYTDKNRKNQGYKINMRVCADRLQLVQGQDQKQEIMSCLWSPTKMMPSSTSVLLHGYLKTSIKNKMKSTIHMNGLTRVWLEYIWQLFVQQEPCIGGIMELF